MRTSFNILIASAVGAALVSAAWGYAPACVSPVRSLEVLLGQHGVALPVALPDGWKPGDPVPSLPKELPRPSSAPAAVRAGAAGRPLVLLVATTNGEFEMLRRGVIGGSEKRVRGVGCLLGTIDGKPVALQKPVPGQGGSAGALGELVLGLRPENVLLAGTAGAVDPGLLPGDVVISDKALSPSGPTTARGLLLAVDPTLSEVAFRASMLGSAAPQPTTGAPKPAVRFRVGTVASREFWTAGRAMDPLTAARLGVIAVDNDTAAVARVCAKHRIPWLSGCGVSHRMGEQAGSEQARYRTLATENSSGFVLRVARTLVGRSRRPPAR